MSQTKAQLISDLVQALNFTGTASAPANGVFLSATNTLAFATNSGSRVTIDSNGKATFSVDGVFNSVNIGKGANSVAGNTVLGQSALDASVTGDLNTAIGKQSLGSNTSGANNTAVGFQAIFDNTTGGNNTAIGVQALANNTTASNNTGAGYGALF